MARSISTVLFSLLLALTFSTLTFAQEKQEMKADPKADMAKTSKPKGPMYSLTCDDACGFSVRSHDEKEAMSIMKTHAKHAHKMEMSEKQLKDMMKTDGGGDMHK